MVISYVGNFLLIIFDKLENRNNHLAQEIEL